MPACTSCVLAPSSISPFDLSAIPDYAWECGIPKFAAAFIISELLSECICMQRFRPSKNEMACWCVSVDLACSGNICFSPVYSSFVMNAYFGRCP